MRAVLLFCVAFALKHEPTTLAEAEREEAAEDQEMGAEIEKVKEMEKGMKSHFSGGPKLEDYEVKEPHEGKLTQKDFDNFAAKGHQLRIDKQIKEAGDDVDTAEHSEDQAEEMMSDFASKRGADYERAAEDPDASSLAQIKSKKFVDTPLPEETDDYQLREAEDKMKITEANTNQQLKDIADRLHVPTDAEVADATSLLQTRQKAHAPHSAAAAADWEKAHELKEKFRDDFDKTFGYESGEADGLEGMDDEEDDGNAPVEAAVDDTDSSFLQTAQKSKKAKPVFASSPTNEKEDDALIADEDHFLDNKKEDMGELKKLDEESEQKKKLIQELTAEVTGQKPENKKFEEEAEYDTSAKGMEADDLFDDAPSSFIEKKAKWDPVKPDAGMRLPTFTNGHSPGNWEKDEEDDEEALTNTEIDEQDSMDNIKEDQIKSGDIVDPDADDYEAEDVVKDYAGKIGGTAGYLGPKDASSLIQTSAEASSEAWASAEASAEAQEMVDVEDQDTRVKSFQARLKHQIEELKDPKINFNKIIQEGLPKDAKPSSLLQTDSDNKVPTDGDRRMKAFEERLSHQIDELENPAIPVDKVVTEGLDTDQATPSSLIEEDTHPSWKAELKEIAKEPKHLKKELHDKLAAMEKDWNDEIKDEKSANEKHEEALEAKFKHEEDEQKSEWGDIKEKTEDDIDRKVGPSSFMQTIEHHVSQEELDQDRTRASKAASDLFRIQKVMKEEEDRMQAAAKHLKEKTAARHIAEQKRHMEFEAAEQARKLTHQHHLDSLRKED